MHKSPATIRAAALLWSIAVAAGFLETMIAVFSKLQAGSIDPGLWANVGVRLLVFAVAAALIVQLVRGRQWARNTLAVGLGVVGLASMVVPTTLGLLAGDGFVEATAGDLGLSYVVVRMIHIPSVIVATTLMFLPTAREYVSGRKGTTAVRHAVRA